MVGILVVGTPDASAGDLSADAQIAYQAYDFDKVESYGFRQTYDLQFFKDVNPTTTLRVFARLDDFSGIAAIGGVESDSKARQLQPGAELTVSGEKLKLGLRSEVQTSTSGAGILESDRKIERTYGRFEWQPDRLPVFNFNFSRNITRDDSAKVDLMDESANVRVAYAWKQLRLSAEGAVLYSSDLVQGYERNQLSRGVDLDYGATLFGDRLSFNALASARLSDIEEEVLEQGGGLILTPVTILRASNGIDDTPSDNDDRPLVPNPSLIDGDLSTSAGISIGPDGQSFHNIALELGRLEKLDEIRVVVRDELGNPLQTGGGAVDWDVWTSEDGRFWTQIVGATTTFNRPLSLYSVRFEQLTKRWIKVVNFGVNVAATLVTEVEAYYYSEGTPGERTESARSDYLGVVGVTARPTDNLALSYFGTVTSADQEYEDRADRSTTSIDHIADVRYMFRAPFTVGASFVSRQSEEQDGIDDSTSVWSGFVNWSPTDRLRVNAGLTQQDQTFEGDVYGLETLSLSAETWVVPALSINLRLGIQSETPEEGTGSARATFLDLTSNAQFTRTIRMGLRASKRFTSQSEGYVPRFLGAARDDRVAADVTWRPAQPFALTASMGWFRGESRSGTTGRIRVEWFPFGEGTLVVGGYVDQDIDTASDREAARAQLLARWTMNRFARFEVNYTAVVTSAEMGTNDQRTLFATLTLTN